MVRGYLKTLEAIVAVVLFLIFLTAILSLNQPNQKESVPSDIKFLQDTILNKLQTDTTQRNCLVINNDTCINSTINSLVPSTIEYDFEICNEVDIEDCSFTKVLPQDKTIYADSLLIQEDNPAMIRLFLWRKLN